MYMGGNVYHSVRVFKNWIEILIGKKHNDISKAKWTRLAKGSSKLYIYLALFAIQYTF